MPNSILLAQPNPLELANHIEGSLEIGGSHTVPGIPQGWNDSFFIIPSSYIAGADNLRKSGADGGAYVISAFQIPARQPFMTQFSMNDTNTDPAHPFSVFVGIQDDLGRHTYVNPYRYPPESQERYWLRVADVSPFPNYLVGVHSDLFQFQSDGNVIRIMRSVNGQFNTIYSFPIPPEVIYWKLFYNCYHTGNFIYTLRFRVDEAIIPVTTASSVLIQTRGAQLQKRIIDATHYGILTPFAGHYGLKLYGNMSQNEDDSLLIDVNVTNLYIRPSDRVCGTYVITGDILQFISNGGQGGIFEADGGTIIPGLKWQAPSASGLIHFTYKVGDVTATCQLNVVPRLGVTGVGEDGYYPDLAQGEAVQFIANCPEATFQCTNYRTIITPQGRLVAPTDAKDAVFGEKDCIIKVTGCGQIYTFRIRIQPMFPTDTFCGPEPEKWASPLIPDFLPTTAQMVGGTSQVKNRNKAGILIWKVDYKFLTQEANPNCTCENESHTSNCQFALRTAKRLDDFYKRVSYVKYFTVLDYHTQIRYKYVRLTSYTGDHSLFKTEQSRSLAMRQEGEVLF